MKRTLVLGASENPDRYSNKAIRALRRNGHEVIAVGKKAGRVGDVEILTSMPSGKSIDTVALYLNPAHQKAYYDSIAGLKPKRIVFNPGAENPEFQEWAKSQDIEAAEDCVLMMLDGQRY